MNGGLGYEPGCYFHSRSCDSVFLFLLDSATVFLPSHPLVSSCLKFIEIYPHFLGSFFFPVVDSDSVIIVMLIEMLSRKCCYIVVWQRNGIVKTCYPGAENVNETHSKDVKKKCVVCITF